MVAGATSAPSIHRQPADAFQAASPRPWIHALANSVRKMPVTMPSWKSEPRRPRRSGGASSAM